MAQRDFTSPKFLLMDLDGTLLGNNQFRLTVDFVKRALRSLSRHGGWFNALRALRAVNRELEKVPKRMIQELTNDQRAVVTFSKALGLPAVEGAKVLQQAVNDLFPLLQRHFY